MSPHLMSTQRLTLAIGLSMFAIVGCGGSGGPQAGAAPSPAPLVAQSSRVNDTGVTSSQCFQEGSDALVSCKSAAALALSSFQDGMLGRDAEPETDNNLDGGGGFSFTKISSSGQALPASAAAWACVQDNVTGLLWEVKTSDGGLRDKNNAYTHFDDAASAQTNGATKPTLAAIEAHSNSVGFKNAVNKTGLCGFNDWRLPSDDELQSLADFGVAAAGPAIDRDWFPDAIAAMYWTSESYPGSAQKAYVVDFSDGSVVEGSRQTSQRIRLVR